jgi:hypothetical protein
VRFVLLKKYASTAEFYSVIGEIVIHRVFVIHSENFHVDSVGVEIKKNFTC